MLKHGTLFERRVIDDTLKDQLDQSQTMKKGYAYLISD